MNVKWEQRKLGETLTGFEYGLNTPATDYDGINKYLRITDIDDVSHKFDISHLTSPKLKDDNYLLANGDILFARTGASVGKSYRYSNIDGKVYYAGFLIKAHIKDHFSTNFIFDTTLLPRYHYFVQVTSMRSGQPGINAKEYQKYIIYAPSENEQNKISDLILTIQKLIDLQQRKLEQLKQLKKAMLQQLFVDKNSKQPNLRFKNFNSDWKQRKLKNISKRILRKNSDLQSLLPLTISAQDGLVDQTLYFNKQVASKQLKNYLLLYNGDFAYNKSYSVGYPYGAIKRLDKYKQGVLSTLYIAFKPTNINSDFLQHYYDTDKWYREIYRNAAEGARNHGLLNISTNDFFNSKLVTPSDNDEQLKIAKIINLFNHLITLRQNKLTQLTTLKKYLLQNLFI
ncbi:restriction endonuclease subunit S [Limosilactobacillus reuteri]|uniref:restriction endonuclease subunit S n=1 Tax=Limosilactobacillus reuteri TaxID=1598 RepID=UPI002B4BDE54|nr:restriction endonuclease subunit S [Limosilactobacillus reuteri]MCC4335051.1 restriction endonuclease subunit S [Limosilactobacillus reuteri]